jgi:hypothetical protein
VPYTTNVPGTTITAAWGNANVRDQVVTPFATALARTSAVSTPISGMVSTRTDAGIVEAYDGTAWQPVAFYPGWLYVRKTADQSVTSSTTLVDDNQLLLSVVANAVYELRMLLIYTAATTGDLNMTFTGPAAATLDWNVGGLSGTSATNPDGVTWWGANTIGGNDSVGGAGATNMVARPSGVLITAGTAGTFKLRWAQAASSGTATTIKTGSVMILQRVA